MRNTKVKQDPAGVLAEKMVAALAEQRQRGPDAYPLTVASLAQLADPKAPPDILQKAIQKKNGFLDKVVVARRGDVHALLALADDKQILAESPELMEFLLRSARTPTNQAISVAQLKNKVSGSLKKSFPAALNRLMDENQLPGAIGWIFVNRTRRLFFLEDLHRGNQQSNDVSPPSLSHDGASAARDLVGSTSTVDFSGEFDHAFEKLNRQGGSINFVSLVDLRRALAAIPRPVFDAELRKLWSEGRYSLRAAEGRFGISPEEREAGFWQEGALLLYVSRNPR